MKIFKSIKWRLQIWYGLILVVVLAGFGITAYQLERNRQFRQIDDELHRRVSMVAQAIHPPPHPRQRPNDSSSMDEPPPRDEPPPEQGGSGYPPEPRDLHAMLDKLDGLLRTTNDLNKFWIWVYVRGDDSLERGTPAEPQRQAGWWGNYAIEQLNGSPQRPETIGEFRGIVQKLPSGETIQVSCHIATELQELHLTSLKLAGVGCVILFFGLAGGWWLVSRAIKPINEISATAVKISAGDLSQRINVAEAESELGQLAAVLNSTFARLEAAFAQQQQFTSDAAHELRTPVSVMLTQTQTALNREREAADYKQTVEACQRAAQRMRRLIESLLALARLDAGQEVLKRLRFDFSKTISECVELVNPLANERGVKISVELEPLEISGDSERLAQVVTNLLTNAVQYNHEGGEARVQLKSENGLAVLTVADNGAGISAEDLPRVFERFYRADKSRSTGGNGLGLAISKAVVEAHGGAIEVASEENAGTIFIVRLPI
jgi:heavy metal sensor kinase